MKTAKYKLINTDCIEGMGKMPTGRVQTCIYSPPYFNQRDYGVDGQLGLEVLHDCLGWATGNSCGDCYVCHQVAVARAVWRVLRDDGTLWVNLGDKYAGGGGHCPTAPSSKHSKSGVYGKECGHIEHGVNVLPSKNLLGIPWRVAFALQADGWVLRSDIIWHRVNAMPGSQRDRVSCSHEYIFMFSKKQRYYYDDVAIQERAKSTWKSTDFIPNSSKDKQDSTSIKTAATGASKNNRSNEIQGGRRTKRSVWPIPVASEKAGHFASYPQRLIMPCILAGTSAHGRCPECYAPYKRIIERQRIPTRPGTDTKVTGNSEVEGNRDPERHITRVKTIGWEPTCECNAGDPQPCIVLDPFAGTGTTLATAVKKNRWAVGFELNPKYIEIAHKKIRKAIATKGFGL